MHRIDHSTREEDLFGVGKDGFTEGDPQASVAATIVTADWANSVQEELAAIVEDGGGVLDKPTLDQVREFVPHLGFKSALTTAIHLSPGSACVSTGSAGNWTNVGVTTTQRGHIFEINSGATGITHATYRLNRTLPSGAVVKRIRAAVHFNNPGSGVRSIDMTLERYGVDFDNWVASATELADATVALASLGSGDSTGRYVMDSGTITQALSPLTDSLALRLEFGGVSHRVHDILIEFLDPGPKGSF